MPHGFYQTLANDPEFAQMVQTTRETPGAKASRIQWVKDNYDVECGDTVIRKAIHVLNANDTTPQSNGIAVKTPTSTEPFLSAEFQQNGTSAVASGISDNIRSLPELLEFMNADLSVWYCKKHILNKWAVGAKGPDGRICVTPLFQVKAWMELKEDVVAAKSEIAALIEEARNHAPAYAPLVHREPSNEGCLLECCIPDSHFGKLCWVDETGDANYDVDIAENIFRNAVEDIVQKASGYKVDRIVFPIGSDMLNADGMDNMTTSGTPQDMDGRFQRTFRRTWKMLVSVIERLSTIAPVDVPSVPGNHDRESTFTIAEVLGAYFTNNPNVNVMNEPTLRKYYSYGNTLLLFTHGSEEKPADLPLLMATERPDLFAAAKHREIHIGHLHKTMVNETHGIRVRVLPSLCASDAWHSRKGFTGNIRSAEAFIWSKTEGLVGTIVHNLPTGPK